MSDRAGLGKFVCAAACLALLVPTAAWAGADGQIEVSTEHTKVVGTSSFEESFGSLERALEVSVHEHVSVKVARSGLATARAQRGIAEAAFRPVVRLTSDLLYTKNYDLFTGVSGSVSIPELNYSTSVDIIRQIPRYQLVPALRADYNLYSGGRDTANLDEMRYRESAAYFKVDEARQRAANLIARRHLALRRACLRESVAAEHQRRAAETLALVKDRLSAGRIPEIEVKVASLALAEADSALATRTVETDAAVSELGTELGVDFGADRPADRCRFLAAISTDFRSVERLVSQSSYIGRLDAEVLAADSKVEAALGDTRPQVGLFTQHTLIGRSNPEDSTEWSRLSRRDFVVGIQFSFTLYDGALSQSRIAAALSNAERVRLVRDEEKAERRQAAQRALSTAAAAERAFMLSVQREKLAIAQAELAALRHANGTISESVRRDSLWKAKDMEFDKGLAELDLYFARLSVLFPLFASRFTEAVGAARID